MPQDRILQRGTVTQKRKGHFYEVSLEDHPEHLVLASLSGTMRVRHIVVLLGDEVTVELSPYDLYRGRIVWRHT